MFVFDRSTGEPIWPIDEVAVPASTVPGERAAPTQPVPSRPPPFERQGVALDQLVDATPQVQAAALEIVSRYDWGDLFEPPSLRGTIVNPGIGGGGNWGGASFDPETRTLYVTSLGSLPFLVRLESGGAPDLWFARPSIVNGPPGYFNLFKPPNATITAYDLDRGEIRWQVPNSGPAGVVGHASSLVTKTLLFYETRSAATLAVLDKASGQRLWEIALPANASGAPMTYMAGGRQHVVVAVGSGDQQPMELVAFRLPRSAVGSPGAVRFAGASARAKERDGTRATHGHAAGRARGRGHGRGGPGGGTDRRDRDRGRRLRRRDATFSRGATARAAQRRSQYRFSTTASRRATRRRRSSCATRPVGSRSARRRRRSSPSATTTSIPAPPTPTRSAFAAGAFACAPTSAPRRAMGSGRATALSADAGYFTFFEEGNVEVLVKVHDACIAPFERFWVFAAGLTDVEVTLTVADTERDVVRRYDNPLGPRVPGDPGHRRVRHLSVTPAFSTAE